MSRSDRRGAGLARARGPADRWIVVGSMAVGLGLSALAAATHPSLPGPSVPDGLGVNIHFTDPLEGEMEMLAGAGVRWVRMDFSWGGTEREPGRYDFSAYDRLVGHLDRHGIRALFILDYGNRLYESERSVRTEAGRAAFARWSAAAVGHFAGRGILWEIWNEPNHAGFWQPAPDPGDYAALAREAAAAIRRVAPGEAIIGPATSGIDMGFLASCFEQGVLDDWDAVSVHPYRREGPETAAADYDGLRRLLREHVPAGREVPILSAEWGYSAAWQGFDEDEQGRLLARQWLTNLAQGIPLSIWYDWRDDGRDPGEAEHHFGMVGHDHRAGGRPPFRVKPAYAAAATLVRTLGGMHFIKRLGVGSTDEHLLLFGDGRRLAVAGWTVAGEARSVLLPAAAGGQECRSHLGAPLPVPVPAGGSAALPLDGAPRYVLIEGMPAALRDLPPAPRFGCELVRVPGGAMLVRVDNRSGGAFAGAFRLTGEAAGSARPLRLSAGQGEATVRLAHGVADDRVLRAGLEVLDAGRVVMEVPARTFRLAGAGLFDGATVRADGDGGDSSQGLSAAGPDPSLPGFEAAVWELGCRFGEGWKFVTVAPHRERAIPGRPTGFGLWIHGDGSGVAVRMRVRDANGRTWQPDGGRVTWRGWRHVSLRLSGSTAHWGGNGGGGLRFPLEWEAPLLLDNVSRKPCRATVRFTAPVVIE